MPDSPVVQWLNARRRAVPRAAARARRRHRGRLGRRPGSRRCWPTPSTGPTTTWSCRRARCTAARRAQHVRRQLRARPRRQGLALQLLRQRAQRGRRWPAALIDDAAGRLPPDRPAVVGRAGRERHARGARRSRARAGPMPPARAAEDRPAVFVLPGILGSNLTLDGKRIWLGLRLVGGLKKLAWDPATRRRASTPDGAIGTELRRPDRAPGGHARGDRVRLRLAPPDRGRGAAPGPGGRGRARRGATPAASRCGCSRIRWAGWSHARCSSNARDIWQRLMARDGARLLMLGTPNGGSWAPMQVLSGDDTFGNTLVAFGALFDDAGTRKVMAGDARLHPAAGRPDRPGARPGPRRHLAEAGRRRPATPARAQPSGTTIDAPAQRLPLGRAAAGRARPRGGAAPAARRAGRQRWAPMRSKMLLVVGRDRFTPAGFRIGRRRPRVPRRHRRRRRPRARCDSALLPGVRTWRCDAAHGKLPDVAERLRRLCRVAGSAATRSGCRALAAPRPPARAAAGRGRRGAALVPSRPSRGAAMRSRRR